MDHLELKNYRQPLFSTYNITHEKTKSLVSRILISLCHKKLCNLIKI